jgi:hypothetical protein
MRKLPGLRQHTRPARGLLDLEVELPSDGVVRLDHHCPEAGIHRLLGVEPTEHELAALRAGREVAIVVRCDRCIWERRLLLR